MPFDMKLQEIDYGWSCMNIPNLVPIWHSIWSPPDIIVLIGWIMKTLNFSFKNLLTIWTAGIVHGWTVIQNGCHYGILLSDLADLFCIFGRYIEYLFFIQFWSVFFQWIDCVESFWQFSWYIDGFPLSLYSFPR